MYVVLEINLDGSLRRALGPCTNLSNDGQVKKYLVKNGYLAEQQSVNPGDLHYSKILGAYAVVSLLETDPLREP